MDLSSLRTISTGTQAQRVEALRSLLNYPIKELDASGSKYWYLRPGVNSAEAEDTCPIAVGFYAECDRLSENEIKAFFTDKVQQQETYGHYTNQIAAQQPVMYLLLPEGEQVGRVTFILPIEGGIRQRQVQSFGWDKQELLGRLSRLQQGQLPIAARALVSIPLVEWVFYEAAHTAKELAQLLAEVTRRMEQALPLAYEAEGVNGYLHNLLQSFQRELLPNLKLKAENEKDYSFSDIYAQTIAYGLFTARVFSHVHDPRADFNRQGAWEQLPETNPFLRRLFQDVSERSPKELGDELVECIAEVFGILRAAKMDAILSDFRQKMNREDIVIRFYEDFLAAYKPKMREGRGVYYTPEPVVSYMVRSVDILLKEKFDKPLGLADPEVMILDPACGTGTFLLWIFKLIYERFENDGEARSLIKQKLGDISWSDYVKDHLLPRVFGFELLMAPYAICHLKLGLFLEESGYGFDSDQRLGVYLTNTLDDAAKKSEMLFQEFIADEANEAAGIKRDMPVMLVIGNPPYSANSANNGEWATNLVRDSYYPKDEIKEQNPKLLLDDYVKFIRFSQWRIDKTGTGILSFVTNHGYLDNPTFRGMRQSLAKSFDSIKVVDLHGNSKKKETATDGTKDENVFDIQQGVATCLMVKNEISLASIIEHAHLYGMREAKYNWLSTHDVLSTDWNEIKPQKPFSLFIPQDNRLLPEYEKGWKISDAMPINSTGIKTHRDHFVLDFDKSALQKRIEDFRDLRISDNQISEKYEVVDTRDWKLGQSRKSLALNQNWEDCFTQCLYRPFDFRNYYHHEDVVELPRNEVMHHMIFGDNLGLVVTRQVTGSEFYHCLCTDSIIEMKTCSHDRGTSFFPLYIIPDPNDPQKSTVNEKRRPNFSDDFLKEITNKLGYTPTPEAIFYYIYAIFHSPTYRTRYAEFLKIDFPRVPLTSDDHLLFRQLGDYGEELVALHLMKSPKLDQHITQFIESGGECKVDAGYPKYANSEVIINKKRDRFTGIPENIWNFYVGGYQVCHKWLKDRKGRQLSPEDLNHYQKIIVALSETMQIMKAIDAAIPNFPIE